MIYKNFEIHGAAEIIEYPDGSVSWLRMPSDVADALDTDSSRQKLRVTTGVELRFVIRSGNSATVTMSLDTEAERAYGHFHVYRGGIQGGWVDHEVDKTVDKTAHPFVIESSKNIERLKVISEKSGTSFSPEVVRIIFDIGRVRIHSIEGDVCPPPREMLPKKTFLAYGSSITHGSNSLTASHAYPSLIARELDLDLINLGMAGTCRMEPAVADYIAKLGKEDKWHVALFELGINVKSWTEAEARTRVTYFIKTVAESNPEKPILVVSPYCYFDDLFGNHEGVDMWRKLIPEVVSELGYDNVHTINGLDVLNDVGLISADEVHPSIYGVYRIAEVLTAQFKKILTEEK